MLKSTKLISEREEELRCSAPAAAAEEAAYNNDTSPKTLAQILRWGAQKLSAFSRAGFL